MLEIVRSKKVFLINKKNYEAQPLSSSAQLRHTTKKNTLALVQSKIMGI
jgi:hypothetical protein